MPLPLPPGTFELEALPPSGNTLAPTIIKNVPVNEARTQDILMEAAAGILTVNLYFPSEAVYNRFNPPQTEISFALNCMSQG